MLLLNMGPATNAPSHGPRIDPRRAFSFRGAEWAPVPFVPRLSVPEGESVVQAYEISLKSGWTDVLSKAIEVADTPRIVQARRHLRELGVPL